MFQSKILLLAALIACANSRYILNENVPYSIIEDDGDMVLLRKEFHEPEAPQLYQRNEISRVRRQAHGNINTNPDGTSNVGLKVPLAGNDKNILSAVGSVGGASGNGGYKAAGGGLAWDNVNGHGATLTGQRIPEFGNQLTAAAKANLFHNDKHDVTAIAFATRTFPNNPAIPNFDTYGGKVGYTYDNKIGAALGMAHTDLFKKTDYSAMGNLNLFRDKASSLDFNAGFSKSVSPYMPSSRWEPSGGFTYNRFF